MKICKWCNESGMFLKVSDIGLCLNCDYTVVSNIHYNIIKIKEALARIKYYDKIENAIENFMEILTHAKALVVFEKKGIRTEDLLPSVLIDIYTWKLNWIKDLRKNGFDVSQEFYFNAADTNDSNEDGFSRQDIISRCRAGDKLFPAASPSSKFKNAIKLMTKNNRQIGWLTQNSAGEFCNRLNDDAFMLDLEISEITNTIDEDYKEPVKGCYIKFTCFQKSYN